jgi:hypothetical protein
MAEWRYRIEDIEDVLAELSERLNFELKPEILATIKKNTNTWLKVDEKITWSKLKATLPYDLYTNIQDMSLRYGYSTED